SRGSEPDRLRGARSQLKTAELNKGARGRIGLDGSDLGQHTGKLGKAETSNGKSAAAIEILQLGGGEALRYTRSGGAIRGNRNEGSIAEDSIHRNLKGDRAAGWRVGG